MARPSKIPTDPAIYDQILENLAYGLPQVRIAESLGIPETTISSWKKRPDFRRDLAVKKLQILSAPLKSMAERFPKDFIERHPDTREVFAPPTQTIAQDINMSTKKALDLTDDELASMIPGKPKPVKEATGEAEAATEVQPVGGQGDQDEGERIVH